ncbi:UDP-N-acetylmuramate--L-alanine ligase [Alkalitalea saponilacus]|uniref:UDP-N-acetylmuramate--L-alanine ligase n=1 Tax=Alkalitalea saponilacus TaxID=889453 RepID=A0A1T5HR24_9BACT|nr:UDP-N-acetylmuramate--L-alanine ligase [Alkalitalea saponilacus]ASB48393.1 UDP-N-acetylmuramate--L-alanine ligase [Alkalitalea saponilacus]SKC23118.1 UDP-N-acetylmuramate--L-alanine ligase [Alkalitalea saponilacus]
MNLADNIKQVWFIGIGGIGMSAVARYFHLKGMRVAGYDRTPSVITDAIESEGMEVCFSDGVELIGDDFRDGSTTLVVFTPAVEASHRQLIWFREHGFTVLKRSEVLGLITQNSTAVCVAGTHGKTTISTMATHLFRQSGVGCTAFLGGISRNYRTNFLWDEKSPFTILEADEFDRSFLRLTPQTAIVSAIDADHLDIYGNKDEVEKAFVEFGNRIAENGNLLIKKGIDVNWKLNNGVRMFTYSLNQTADFYAKDVQLQNGRYCFNMVTPFGEIEGLTCGIPGLVNVENAIGAMALALLNGVDEEEIRKALPTFTGIARRFDVLINQPQLVYIDDYAHHPEEIRATLSSVKNLYPGVPVTGIFQPHLFTRTRDFAEEFAASLSVLDEVLLMDIYPARENPIEGVDSQMIGEKIKNISVIYCNRTDVVEKLNITTPRVVISMGAGDIDREVNRLKDKIEQLIKQK